MATRTHIAASRPGRLQDVIVLPGREGKGLVMDREDRARGLIEDFRRVT
jgi:hypothetical protein